MSIRAVFELIRKEMVLEWRNRYALQGLLLYVAGTVFICYLSFQLKTGAINAITWNALFWIILLFAAVNAVSKSFLAERRERMIYYQQLVNGSSFFAAKLIYNTLLLWFIAVIAWCFYVLVMGNPIQHALLFGANMILGCIGFSAVLCLVSAIAAQAQGANALMAILSFPILIPLLVLLIKISKNAVDGLDPSVSYGHLLTLFATIMILISTSFLLFPYLWRS